MGDQRVYRSRAALEAQLARALEERDDLARTNAELQKVLGAKNGTDRAFAVLERSGVVGVVVVMHDGTIIEANDAFLRIVGYSRAELIGRKGALMDLTPPEWVEATEQVIRNLDEHGVQEPWEKEYLRKDGTRARVLLASVSIGERATVVFAVDLSEKQRAEDALRLKEEQLREAQKMEAIGQLAGGVAHDFNNLLCVILSYSCLLADMFPEGETRTDIEEIRSAATRAADLTKQLLLFSRHQVTEPVAIDLGTVVSRIEKMLRRTLGEDIDLVVKCGENLGSVFVDPCHMDQVLMNLAVNARDAMPQGGTLLVETSDERPSEGRGSASPGSDGERYVVLTVTDTGTGMNAATKAHIFEPFFTTKEPGKGTGLGLSTVFGIVQRSGGKITVESEPGVGTTFRIHLPRAEAAPAEERPVAHHTTLRGTETILLVEDEDQVRAVASNILRRQGYRVLDAKGPAEALRLAAENSDAIDLLLTDVVMPVMSGPDLARRVASAQPRAKVLCMSGYTNDVVVRHGIVEGGFAFLQKPITPVTLALKVREVLEQGRAA